MFEKFMCKTRFTININLFDIITFIIVLIGLSFVVTVYATKIIVGYRYDFWLCIVSFIYISTYLLSVYIPTYFVLKPQKTKHKDDKTV
ncbi:hypothetical protein ACS47_04895 [Bacillus cereus]|jgi:uncharacterized Tic20 family protein|nr:hypothetical protein ACS47_04895 [Bacillus cereus]KXI93314.1 hypothetical protein ACS46_06470 [Bacillus cereus]